ncbi:MAG: sensor histidine kinase [Hansschlegelia sp.]
MFKTLRSRIAILLIAANLPVILFAILIGKQEFELADRFDRDRLVQAAALVAARAKGVHSEASAPDEAARRMVFRDRGSRGEIAAALVGPTGEPIALDDEAPPFGREWLPEKGVPTAALPDDPRVLKGRGEDGRAYRYAVAAIRDSDARAVVGAPYDILGRSQTQWLFLALGLPALMILLCVGLVLFGIERFVLRWIRMLRTTASAYDGEGLLDAKLSNFNGAPQELSELRDAFEGMSKRIEDRSTALTTAIEERDRLLRELHHRVKNNFQMIASLLALQRQEAPETLSQVLRPPEDRVRAMAAAYKVSYASGEIGHVGVAELIRDVATQARQSGDGRVFSVAVHFPEEAFEVDLDRAVSLALLLTEMLTAASIVCAVASVTAAAAPDGRLALTIAGPPAGWLPKTGLSQRLIGAYAQQLSTTIEELDGGAIKLCVALAMEKPSIGMRPRKAPAA